jgi:hypothetical protein
MVCGFWEQKIVAENSFCTQNNLYDFVAHGSEMSSSRVAHDKLASNEAFICFVNISALHIKLPASTDGSCGFIAQPGIKRQSTCTWHISTHFWCCENAIPWHNLASNETDAEHIELTEYRYEDIESCIGKQTLISSLLRQPRVQRLKSDNVKVNCLHHFWKE